jgi:NAD(P)-dependent dehydrogenase (short-subunit alcohol dehydrogenase family)
VTRKADRQQTLTAAIAEFGGLDILVNDAGAVRVGRLETIPESTRDEAMEAAGYLAAVLGRAHARQMEAPTRKKWQEELKRHRPKKKDAPS